MKNHAVVIAGGGPTGLVLAAELALARVDVVIVERRATQELEGTRGGGLHARTIEVLDQRGVADRFLSRGQKHQLASFMIPLDLSDCPTRHGYTLALGQAHIERILAEWVAELGVETLRGRDVIDFTEDATGVDVRLSDGEPLRAEWLAGCDGGRSLIRKKAGIEFPGSEPTTSFIIAEALMSETPPRGMQRDAKGVYAIGPHEDGKRVRCVLREERVVQGEAPTLEDLRALLMTIYKTDFGLQRATWLSRFTDGTRQAAQYRKGRVLLAGDAAHIHPPVGGQGLNLGVQDAVNLGWKLARVVSGTSTDALLDTYHSERHAVGARTISAVMAMSALNKGDDHTEALRAHVADMLSVDEVRRRYAAKMSALDIHYDASGDHPLAGRRMPDLDLVIDGRTTTVFSLLHQARPVLLSLDGTKRDLDHVKCIAARYDGEWKLPAIGEVSAPRAVLIRPDGHVAWVDAGRGDGLHDAIARWHPS